MPTRGVHGDVDIGGFIDTPPPADKAGKLSLEKNVRAAAKAYSDALALYFCNVSIGDVIATPPPANKVGKLALMKNVCAAKKAYSDALALDPVVQAVPAHIGLDVPALPEVIAPAASCPSPPRRSFPSSSAPPWPSQTASTNCFPTRGRDGRDGRLRRCLQRRAGRGRAQARRASLHQPPRACRCA